MPPTATAFAPWQQAWEHALYGARGFYTTGSGALGHFRTSVSASPLFAEAVFSLLIEVDHLLGHPDPVEVVDMAAGRGQLAHGLAMLARQHRLGQRLRVHAVEVSQHPPSIDASVRWVREAPPRVTGLIIANEWLDNVACPVVETTTHGSLALVEVDPAGKERLGEKASPEHQRWLRQWWPLPAAQPGLRAEIGSPRDLQWSELVRRLDRGVAVAIDYATTLEQRRAGLYRTGTLTAYRAGRQVLPVPDGSCDLTAAVALDACAAAVPEATSAVVSQAHALPCLGLSPAAAPQTHETGQQVLQRLARRSQRAELLDPAGQGGFTWLAQSLGCPLPASLIKAAHQEG